MRRRFVFGITALLTITAAVFAGDESLPEGDGKILLKAACSSCHSLDIVRTKQYSKLRWQAIVSDMAARGAPIKKEDYPNIVEYLAKNFGEDRGKRLVEDICSLCHEWQRVKSHPMSREQWTGVIKGMIAEGAPVTDEEFKLIIDYLAANYGPDASAAKP